MDVFSVVPFSTRLTQLMQERNLTGYRLAKLTGLSQVAIMAIAKGTTKDPRPDNLRKIADALQVPYQEMLEGTDLEPDVFTSDNDIEAPLNEPLHEAYKVTAETLAKLDVEDGFNPFHDKELLREPVPPNFGGSNFAVVRMAHALMEPEIKVGDWVFVDLNAPKLTQEDFDAVLDGRKLNRTFYTHAEELDDGTLIAALVKPVGSGERAIIGRKMTAPDGSLRITFGNPPTEFSPVIKKFLGRVVGITRAYISSSREENELFA